MKLVESGFEYILIKWFILMNDAFAHCFLTPVKKHWKIVQKLNLFHMVGKCKTCSWVEHYMCENT